MSGSKSKLRPHVIGAGVLYGNGESLCRSGLWGEWDSIALKEVKLFSTSSSKLLEAEMGMTLMV